MQYEFVINQQLKNACEFVSQNAEQILANADLLNMEGDDITQQYERIRKKMAGHSAKRLDESCRS